MCAVLLAAMCPAPARAGVLSTVARDLARSASEAGFTRVAVLPLSPADDSPAAQGKILSEILLTSLVREKGVEVVERSLVDRLLEERRITDASALPAAVRQEMARLLSVDAIVTGSFLSRGEEVMVYARLIDLETGAVRGAGEQSVRRVMLGDGLRGTTARAGEAVPEYCVGSEEVVDRIESRMLDLKARYWALQMRRGVSISALKVFPGSAITDNDLRQKLYDRMNEWYGKRRVPELDSVELQQFLSLDRWASVLHHGCAGMAAEGRL